VRLRAGGATHRELSPKHNRLKGRFCCTIKSPLHKFLAYAQEK